MTNWRGEAYYLSSFDKQVLYPFYRHSNSWISNDVHSSLYLLYFCDDKTINIHRKERYIRLFKKEIRKLYKLGLLERNEEGSYKINLAGKIISKEFMEWSTAK